MDNLDLDTDKRTSIYSLRMPDLMKARCDRCSQGQSKILNDRLLMFIDKNLHEFDYEAGKYLKSD